MSKDNSLELNKNILTSKDKDELVVGILDKIDNLLYGLDADDAINIIVSYLAKSIAILSENNKRKAFSFIDTFNKGLLKVTKMEIDRRLGIDKNTVQ